MTSSEVLGKTGALYTDCEAETSEARALRMVPDASLEAPMDHLGNSEDKD